MDCCTSSGWRWSFIFSTLLRVWPSLRMRIEKYPCKTYWRRVSFGKAGTLAGATTIGGCPVEAALGLVHPGPAAGPRVLIVVDGPRLRLAPDALVPLVQERVDGDVVPPDVVPDLLVRPGGERGYLRGVVALLPRGDLRVRPLRGLLAPDARHPGVVALKCPLERLDLADLAAQVGRAGAHLLAVALDLLLHRERGSQDLDRQLVPAHYFLAKLGGLLEDKARVDGEDGHFVGDLRDHVQKGHPLAAPERGRERQVVPVGLDSPAYDLPRIRTLQAVGLEVQLLRVRHNPILLLKTQGFRHRGPPSGS